MKKDNKGFSLVELIVVVAIMAVLMVVLAPQLLRYVEQTRLQKDNSAIAEIANAIELAMTNETVNDSITTSESITITNATGEAGAVGTGAKTVSFAAPGEGASDTRTALVRELELSIGDSFTTSSNTYNSSTTAIVITVTKEANGTISIEATGIYEYTNDTDIATPVEL